MYTLNVPYTKFNVPKPNFCGAYGTEGTDNERQFENHFFFFLNP